MSAGQQVTSCNTQVTWRAWVVDGTRRDPVKDVCVAQCWFWQVEDLAELADGPTGCGEVESGGWLFVWNFSETSSTVLMKVEGINTPGLAKRFVGATQIVNEIPTNTFACPKVFWRKKIRYWNLAWIIIDYCIIITRSQWPCGLRRRSVAARLLRLWVRIPPGSWMFVCCECYVCCQVEVSETSRSLAQRSSTDCGASLCVF